MRIQKRVMWTCKFCNQEVGNKAKAILHTIKEHSQEILGNHREYILEDSELHGK